MAGLFVSPFAPALALNGSIAPAATLTFYTTGTTTAQNVYADAGLVTSLGSVVTANAQGQFVAIYLKKGTLYRAVYKTSGGTVLGDIDPIGDSTPSQIVSLLDYSGTTVAQFNSAMTYLSSIGGGILSVPPGAYNLASAELATPILIYSNTTIEGSGSRFTVTGGGIIGSVFRSVDTSNITIRNMIVTGNSQAVADASSGAFLNFVHDASGTGSSNILVENVSLLNFAAERWISVVNTNVTGKTIQGVRLRNISAVSATGNNLGGASIGIGANAIMIYGVTAPILDVEITNLYVEATYIKCGVNIFHQVNGVTINSPHILNAGLTGTSDDKGAYAINCYGNVGELTDITVNNPLISAPRSCGVYVRGAKRVAINNPYISGQTDQIIATLPKGAIAMDGSADVTVKGGVLSGNYLDFQAAADTTTNNFNNTLRGVKMIGASGYAVYLNPATGAGSPDGVNIIDCQIDSNLQGIYISNNQAASGRSFKNVTIQGGKIIARAGSAIALNPNGSAVCTTYRINNVYIAATNHGINADNATGDLTINDVIIEDAGSSLLTYGIIARTFPQLHIDNVLIRGMGAGYATLTDGANGTINTLRTFNVVNGCSPNSLGMIAPTLTGTAGWFVQNLNPVEAGVAASKYVNTGWRYTTSWLQQRTLTGN
jgi:hypothetical protein